MKLLNKHDISPGDTVTLLQMNVTRKRWATITVEEIRTASNEDWNDQCRNQLCVWWANGRQRWPISHCRKVQQ